VKTSGAGTEGLFILGGICLLTIAGIAVMGGPHNFFQAANRALLNAVEHVVLWTRAHF